MASATSCRNSHRFRNRPALSPVVFMTQETAMKIKEFKERFAKLDVEEKFETIEKLKRSKDELSKKVSPQVIDSLIGWCVDSAWISLDET